MYYRALPDLDFCPSLLLVDGPWALVEWAEICHVVAPFDGIPADGRELRLRAVDLFEIRDGRGQPRVELVRGRVAPRAAGVGRS